MKLAIGYILLVLSLGFSFQSQGQNITLEAIEIGSVSQSGSGNLPSVDSFLLNTRSPALFRTSIISEVGQPNVFNKTGLRIDFIFSLERDNRHQFKAGIERAAIESDLYLVSGSIQDTLSVSANYKTRNEYFFLKSGYQFVHRPGKRFTLIAGGQLNFGIPVSSRTEELITINKEIGEEEYRFFGKQSASAGISIPVGIRFKLFRNVSMSMLIRQSFQYYRLDGTPLFTSMRGTNVGFHFKLRD